MFFVMSNELSTPKLLFCPSEYQADRSQASTFLGSQAGGAQVPPGTTYYVWDKNISYFIGIDADDTFPQMFLTGDHNIGPLTAGAEPISPSIFGNTKTFCQALGTNGFASGDYDGVGGNGDSANWVSFGNNQHVNVGNVALTDGSVTSLTRSALQSALMATGDSYHTDTDGGGGGGGVNKMSSFKGPNRIQFP